MNKTGASTIRNGVNALKFEGDSDVSTIQLAKQDDANNAVKERFNGAVSRRFAEAVEKFNERNDNADIGQDKNAVAQQLADLVVNFLAEVNDGIEAALAQNETDPGFFNKKTADRIVRDGIKGLRNEVNAAAAEITNQIDNQDFVNRMNKTGASTIKQGLSALKFLDPDVSNITL